MSGFEKSAFETLLTCEQTDFVSSKSFSDLEDFFFGFLVNLNFFPRDFANYFLFSSSSQASIKICMLLSRPTGSHVASFFPKFLHLIRQQTQSRQQNIYLFLFFCLRCTLLHTYFLTFQTLMSTELSSFLWSWCSNFIDIGYQLFSFFIFLYDQRQVRLAVSSEQSLWLPFKQIPRYGSLCINRYHIQSNYNCMSCPPKYFFNLQGLCQKCLFGCLKCISSTSCDTCQPYFDLKDNQCHYFDSLSSGLGPIIAAVIVVSFLLLFVLFVCCSIYLEQKRLNRMKQKPNNNDPVGQINKFSNEIVQHPTIEFEIENPEVCLFCRKTGVNTETRCHHRFHWVCIEEWLEISSCCPICKSTDTLPLTKITNNFDEQIKTQIQEFDSGKVFIIHKQESYDVLTEERPEKRPDFD